MNQVKVELIEDREYWYCPNCEVDLDWECFNGYCDNCGELLEVDR